MKAFWAQHPKWPRLPLYFFGSGCYRPEGRQKVEELLSAIGFQRVRVQSDVHAAAHAALGRQAGWVAILGTGSVLIEWDGSEVRSIVGGKGHLEGDEGSGYYFGHLLVDHHEKHTLSAAGEELFTSFLLEHPGFPETGQEKAQLASLATRFGARPEFEAIHEENIRSFLQSYAQSMPSGIPLHFIGSYAEAQAQRIPKLLAEFGLVAGQIIGRPIERLVEQSVYFID